MSGHNSSTDYSDPEIFQDSQPMFSKESTNRKRRMNTDKISTTKKTKSVVMTLEEKKEMLSFLDPEKKLAIYDYIDSYHKDVLVKCFVDNILEYKVLPILPSPELMLKWCEHDIDVEVRTDTMKRLVDNFLKYFQSKYFYNNSTKATKAEKCLFNPKTNFFIPNFNDLPMDTHEKLNQAKKDYVFKVQVESAGGIDFVTQQFVLRNIEASMLFIKNTLMITDNEVQKKYLEKILGMAYTAAKMEFPTVKNIKAIDWTSYESKHRETLPAWRKTENAPPPTHTSKLSTEIFQKIDNGKLKFDGDSLIKRDKEFQEGFYKKPNYNKNFKADQSYQNRGKKKTSQKLDSGNSQASKQPDRKIIKGRRRGDKNSSYSHPHYRGNTLKEKASQQSHEPITNAVLTSHFT